MNDNLVSMKKNLFIISLLISSVCIGLHSCYSYGDSEPVGNAADVDSVRATIHNAIGWARNKDFRLINRIIANDSDYLEVDPDSGIIRGFSQFKLNELLWESANFKAIRYDIRDLKINFSLTGDVAWFYCVLDDINEWKGQPVSWMNTRWTGVLEKRNGHWIIVQMHFSFARE